MKIKELAVERDEMGFWTHPEMPVWDESLTNEEVAAFEKEHHIKVQPLSMENDADDAVVNAWFEDGETCIAWKPTPPSKSSFLLSIHDTEDGPCALWAVPQPIEIMIDVECMGKGSKAALTSLGAVVFDPRTGELGADFEEVINLNSSVYYGGEIDSSTVVWWLQQSEKARAIYAKETPKSSLKDALLEFNQWLADLGHPNDLYLWGNGKEFDNVIVKNAFASTSIKPNFSHWNDMDVRTIVKLGRDILGIDPKSTLERKGVHHTALADAKFQARYVSEIWQALDR